MAGRPDLDARAQAFQLGKETRPRPSRPAKEGTWLRGGGRPRAPPPKPSRRALLDGIRSPSLGISPPFPESFGKPRLDSEGGGGEYNDFWEL